MNFLLLTAGEIGHDSIVVSTSRCGRENPGSNPGHGRVNALNGKPAQLLCYDEQN